MEAKLKSMQYSSIGRKHVLKALIRTLESLEQKQRIKLTCRNTNFMDNISYMLIEQ